MRLAYNETAVIHFSLPHFRGVGAMEIVAMDMKARALLHVFYVCSVPYIVPVCVVT